MTTSEKVAYLKGLAEGLSLGKDTKEEKLIGAIIDVLETVAEDIEDLEDAVCDLGDELDAVSEDLSDLEDLVYDELEDCCCGDYDDYDDDCCCHGHDEDGHEGCCHGHDEDSHEGCCHGEGEGHHHEHEGGCCHGHGEGRGHGHGGHGGGCCHGHHHGVMYEVTCPGCDNTITIDEEVLALGSIQCPSCGGILEFDVSDAPAEPEQTEE